MEQIDLIKHHLDNTRGSWPDVARESGVNIWWIYKFMAGGIPKPGHDKVTKLVAYFEQAAA